MSDIVVEVPDESPGADFAAGMAAATAKVAEEEAAEASHLAQAALEVAQDAAATVPEHEHGCEARFMELEMRVAAAEAKLAEAQEVEAVEEVMEETEPQERVVVPEVVEHEESEPVKPKGKKRKFGSNVWFGSR